MILPPQKKHQQIFQPESLIMTHFHQFNVIRPGEEIADFSPQRAVANDLSEFAPIIFFAEGD